MCRCLENLQRSGVGSALVVLAAIFAAGCAGMKSPPPVTEPTVPDAWQESRQDTSAAQGPTAEELAVWWRQLGDPVLDELVERTMAGNLDLETAAARVEEARALRGVTRSELGPSVSAGWGSARSEALGDQVAPNDTVSASLDIAWEADLFRRKRLSLAASQADLESEKENFRAVQVSLVAETVAAYADLRVAEARLAVLDENLASREQTFQLTRWREQAGLASRLEANQARSSLGEARAGRPAFEQLAIDARLRLSLLAGEAPGTLEGLLGARAAEVGIPSPPDAVSPGIPAETLRQRPDVRSAERQIEAAWARLGAAKASRYPSFALTGSLDARSTDVGDLFNANSVVANLVNGLTAPIFESGRIKQNIAVREAQYEQTALAYQSTVLVALSEVEQALSAYQSSQQRIVALEEAVRSAEEAAELADQRYAAGLVDLLPVLDTQRTLFSLEDQLVNARGELLRAFSNLYRALGGGWDSASQEPAAPGGSHV